MLGKIRAMKMLRMILISCALLLLGFCSVVLTSFIRQVSRPGEVAEGVGSVDWLPAEATNISYHKDYMTNAYEFQISEAGFRQWAAEVASEPVSEFLIYEPVADIAKDEPCCMYRYKFFAGKKQASMKGSDEAEWFKSSLIEIENGLRGELRFRNGGGYSIGYDRDSGTAYWHWSRR